MIKIERAQVESIAKRYKQLTLWLTVGMSLCVLFACRVSPSCESILPKVVDPLVVSALFSIVTSLAYGEAWRSIAQKSPMNLGKYYLVASALKMLLGIVVFLVYVLVCDRDGILGFTAIFSLFYIVLLVFDCVYFSQAEKKARI